MSKLIIVRGIPGAGKSTFAKTLLCGHNILLEADMYLYKETGDFHFSKLYRAHQWCLDTTKILMIQGKEVIVANTFTTWAEIVDYVKFAKELNYCIEVHTITTQFNSIHNVPIKTMNRMRARFQSHDSIMQKINEM